MNFSPRFFVLAWFALLSCAPVTRADVRMPLLFGDHMVLQQETRLPVWGWAAPGEPVTVTFGQQTGRAVAGADGKWRVELPAIKATGTAGTLTIAGKNTVTFEDVLVGDVWVASGQSNMEFGIRKKLYEEDLEKSADPLLRLFFYPRTTALSPLEDILPEPLTYAGQSAASAAATLTPPDPYRAKWVLCTPEALRKIHGQGFATVAYLFARDIRAQTQRPLGIIQSAWGGTRAESWTSLAGLQQDPPFTKYVERQQRQVAAFPALEAAYPQKKTETDATLARWNEEVGKPWNKARDEWKRAVRQAQADGQPLPPEPKPATPKPSDLHPPDNDTNTPGNLFNAMISPLTSFAIKGVIWYQGEFNSGYESGREYRTLFPRMIADWRQHWGRDFPFLFVQLPNYGPIDTQPSVEGGGWRWVREAQLKALALPNTGMVIAIDAGDPNDIHPVNKYDVAKRLALIARRVAYGEAIVASGPLYDTMKIEGNRIRLTFTQRGSGLKLGVPPYQPDGKTPAPPTELKGFGIAGADHVFVWARAVIDGDTVVVSSDQVAAPLAVRYNFSNSPQGNLYNQENLPASPFRTDTWDEKAN